MILIKLGGHALSGSTNWIDTLKKHWLKGTRFVIVHGGGPQIDLALKAEKIDSEFRDGLRVTSESAMKIVSSTLTGTVQRSIVDDLRRFKIPAVGISGTDGGIISAVPKDNGKYGLVGDVTSINIDLIQLLLNGGFIPVISPIASGENGESLNINADIAAGAIGGTLEVDEVIFMTDVPGIYRNWPEKNSIIEKISIDELQSMSFVDGMIPKVEAVRNAINSGASSARIIDGKDDAALDLALQNLGGTWIQK